MEVVVADTEKVSMNMSVVDLGQIDLLVDQGFYSSRTDFLRIAIRQQLLSHEDTVKQVVTRKHMVVGVLHYSRAGLEASRTKGEQIEVRVVGLLIIDQDVPPELVTATIKSVQVHGVIRANEAVKQALAARMM